MDKKIVLIGGSKRSGSTHLMKLMNLHPEVYISNEADVLWVLYQFYKGQEFKGYHLDGDKSINRSLAIAKNVLDINKPVLDNFYAYQMAVMAHDFGDRKAAEGLSCVGDQAPYQHIDADILKFFVSSCPGVRIKYIHLYRHPFDAINSSTEFVKRFNRHDEDDYMTGLWIETEEKIKKVKAEFEFEFLPVDYDSLLRNTFNEMNRIFSFLEVAKKPAVLLETRFKTFTKFKLRERPVISPEQEAALNGMGYKTNYSLSSLKRIQRFNTLAARFDFQLTRLRRLWFLATGQLK